MRVTVTRSVAKAFELLKEYRNNTSNDDLLKEHAEAVVIKDWCNDLEALNDVSLITFAQMMINGYRVEETPVEELARVYSLFWSKGFEQKDKFAQGVAKGIDETLRILGIKVAGVNTHDRN